MEMGEERRGDLSRCGWDARGTRKWGYSLGETLLVHNYPNYGSF